MNNQTAPSFQTGTGVLLPDFFYAGILRRFLAFLVDSLVVVLATFVLFFPLFLLSAVLSFFVEALLLPFATLGSMTFGPFAFFLGWIYFAWLESSEKGATIGKRLLGVRVVDEGGGRIGFGRATVRHFAKILSAMPMMLGFVLALFTRKNQALHDLLAETVVVRTK